MNTIRECFLAPAHAGRLPAAASGRADSASAGAVVEVDLTVNAGTIGAAAFRAYGPPATVAAADWVCGWAAGRTLAAARGLSVQALAQALALPAGQRECALVVLDALAAACSQVEAADAEVCAHTSCDPKTREKTAETT